MDLENFKLSGEYATLKQISILPDISVDTNSNDNYLRWVLHLIGRLKCSTYLNKDDRLNQFRLCGVQCFPKGYPAESTYIAQETSSHAEFHSLILSIVSEVKKSVLSEFQLGLASFERDLLTKMQAFDRFWCSKSVTVISEIDSSLLYESVIQEQILRTVEYASFTRDVETAKLLQLFLRIADSRGLGFAEDSPLRDNPGILVYCEKALFYASLCEGSLVEISREALLSFSRARRLLQSVDEEDPLRLAIRPTEGRFLQQIVKLLENLSKLRVYLPVLHTLPNVPIDSVFSLNDYSIRLSSLNSDLVRMIN
jgi:hypothetical protein